MPKLVKIRVSLARKRRTVGRSREKSVDFFKVKLKVIRHEARPERCWRQLPISSLFYLVKGSAGLKEAPKLRVLMSLLT